MVSDTWDLSSGNRVDNRESKGYLNYPEMKPRDSDSLESGTTSIYVEVQHFWWSQSDLVVAVKNHRDLESAAYSRQ